MDISKMTDQVKSVLLAKAMGLEIGEHPIYEIDWFFKIPEDWDWECEWECDLYRASRMAIAWRVLNWASSRDDAIDDYSFPYILSEGVESFFTLNLDDDLAIWKMPPEMALRFWLDEILELAIEAGIIEEE